MSTNGIQREIPMLAAMQAPRCADEKTVRLCDSEEDAIAVSIALSGLTQVEIARRMGISKGYLSLLKSGHRTLTVETMAKFCSATGWDVVRQYRALKMAMRIASGAPREADRIALIASYTRAAA